MKISIIKIGKEERLLCKFSKNFNELMIKEFNEKFHKAWKSGGYILIPDFAKIEFVKLIN